VGGTSGFSSAKSIDTDQVDDVVQINYPADRACRIYIIANISGTFLQEVPFELFDIENLQCHSSPLASPFSDFVEVHHEAGCTILL
jgi:hypothetical protein